MPLLLNNFKCKKICEGKKKCSYVIDVKILLFVIKGKLSPTPKVGVWEQREIFICEFASSKYLMLKVIEKSARS